jgi:superoxide dismutase, Cu-Zn family
MRTVPTVRGLLALAVIAACAALLPGSFAGAASSPVAPDDFTTGRATVKNVSGATLGTLVIQNVGGGRLAIAGKLTGLAPGFHGFHIHGVGICNPTAVDPATGLVVPFFTAGGHLNPGGATHGSHAGDLPSLLVGRDGVTRQVVETDAATVANIFDADGSAFIVHAAPDNFANIPTRYTSSTTGLPGPDTATLATGDSGGRFACGVITH